MTPKISAPAEEAQPDRGIGTLREKSLHAELKRWYSQPGDRLEVDVDGYTIDIVRGDLLIEIQTRNFWNMKQKLADLTAAHPVHLVHPIAAERWIVRLPESGDEPIDRRKSPRRGRLDHLFTELVRFPGLMANPNFSLEILLIQEEETRRNDGKGAWRRKGWSIVDRRLVKVVERLDLRQPSDFRIFLPPGLPQPFTARRLASARGIPAYLARKMIYCLRAMELVELVGRRGRTNLYRELPAQTYGSIEG